MPKKSVGAVMSEFKHGKLHSGSKHGPKVTSRKQAIAIGMSEARKAGADLPPEHHSNPTQYYGSGDVPAVSDGGGPLQVIEYTEGLDQFEEGPDEFQMDAGPGVSWPGEKVKQTARRQAY